MIIYDNEILKNDEQNKEGYVSDTYKLLNYEGDFCGAFMIIKTTKCFALLNVGVGTCKNESDSLKELNERMRKEEEETNCFYKKTTLLISEDVLERVR